MNERWDHETDFLVIGSGGGGMTAALMAHDLGADTLVVEKSEKFGGSTGMSGGAIWVANNRHMKRCGIADSREEGLTYLRQVTKGRVPEARLAAYVDYSLEMVNYLEENGNVKLSPCPTYPDYYPDYEGGKPGARSLEPLPYSARKLGIHAGALRRSEQGLVLGRMGITAVEAKTLVAFSFLSYVLMFWVFVRYYLDFRARRKGRADNRLTLGTSLVGRLRRALLDRKVPLWLATGAEELIVEGGRVVGAVVTQAGERKRIRAKSGVLLAAGGFARNQAMREEYMREPANETWSAGNVHNQGDGIRMAQAVGASVALMDDAWWTPVTMMPDQFAWLLVVEKSMPGGIMVNAAGKRFTNEAAPYVDVVNGMYDANNAAAPSIPSWLVFDARYRRSYPLGPLGPSRLQPDNAIGGRLRKFAFLKKAKSLDALAEKIGVDPVGLLETVERFGEFAKTGKDEDFGRGDSAYDRYYTDEKIGPNPSLAPIVEAPFYAIEVFPGDLGTKGGVVTDANAQALREDGTAISGLYATGNCSASVMDRSYPGAGGTIGPSMTFAYLAAHHALGQAKITPKEEVAAAAQ